MKWSIAEQFLKTTLQLPANLDTSRPLVQMPHLPAATTVKERASQRKETAHTGQQWTSGAGYS